MRVVSELPKEVGGYIYHRFFGDKDIRKILREQPNVRTAEYEAWPDEYAISFHNHSRDGTKQDIRDIAHEACLRGCKVVAITDHNTDIPFKQEFGQRVIGHYDFDGKRIYIMRGIECQCEFEEKFVDLVFIGYKRVMIPGMQWNRAINMAFNQGALIGITSPFNVPFIGPRREQIEKILETGKIDYTEILNASKPAPFSHNDALANVLLRRYNVQRKRDNLSEVAGIYVSDSHCKGRVMDAFFGVKKSRLEFLDTMKPEDIENNPQMLIEALRRTFRKNDVANYGGYRGFHRIIGSRAGFKSLLIQTFETLWKDYRRGRFAKHRLRHID